MKNRQDTGSALIMAVFVLALLTVMGTSLLFLSQLEVKMSQASVRAQKAFYLAEAGLEDGRATLFAVNAGGGFSNDLSDGSGGGSAGLNGVIDFDPDTVQAVYDSWGRFIGFAGYGDDIPLRFTTGLGDGWYAAFLTNDAVDGRGNLVDSNNRVVITGVGGGSSGSMETVQAVIEVFNFPPPPPSTLTLLGPTPDFYGGNSNVAHYDGEDCGGAGIPGLFVPTVGAIDADAAASAEDGIIEPNGPDYESGPYTQEDTFTDLSDSSDPLVTWPITSEWTDCQSVHDLIEELRKYADYYCTNDEDIIWDEFGDVTSGNNCTIPDDIDPGSVIFIDGNINLGPNDSGSGILVVTGQLSISGNTSWDGIILAVGEGELRRYGGGDGLLSGTVAVADIAGPDEDYGTTDDCTGGPDDDGFGIADYRVDGGGNGDINYCTTDIAGALTPRPYDIITFRQR